MLIGDVRPTTLNGIKRLATQLRNAEGLKHSDALDLAAKAAGCINYKTAQKGLPRRAFSAGVHYVFLTIYWCDPNNGYKVGRETLRIELSKPLLEICGKNLLREVRGFGNLRIVADDHLVCDTLAATQEYARSRLCTAERSLRFMEATGLLPSRDYRKAYRNTSCDEKLPNSDHSTNWVDPSNGRFILIDEPYSGVPDEGKRSEWAAKEDWVVIKTAWPGMYNPYHCDLYIATRGEHDAHLQVLIAKIENMAPPKTEAEWDGESVNSWDTFTSPLAITPQDKRRARCKGTIIPEASAKTTPYSFSHGSSPRRPLGKMGIDDHIEVGRMIKAIMWAKHRPYGVYTRMESLRCTLEDWMGLEKKKFELEGSEFLDVYYGGLPEGDPLYNIAKSRDGLIWILTEIKSKLVSAYPDCAPLRTQIRRVDVSVAMIKNMKSNEKSL